MNRQINVHITDNAGWEKECNGSRELLSFLENEASFWEEQYKSIDRERFNIHHYIECFSVINNAISSIKQWGEDNSMDDGALGFNIQNLINQIGQRWIWSGHPYIDVFVGCNRQHGNSAAEAFIQFVTNRQVGNLQDHNQFSGVLAAYEFLNQSSDISKRRGGEKASIDRLRRRLEKTTSTLINEVEDFKTEFNSWGSETQQEWAELLEKSSGEHSNQQSEHRDKFTSYMKDCESKIEALENTYQEKLRMEKPAKYWNKAAKKFRAEGVLFGVLLIISLFLGAGYLSNFFTEWLKGQELQVQLDSLQGIVIFGTFIAVFAFLIRVLSRLTFSSVHLMRDAEEREQLTYLYLSLINEKKIDEGSRDLILRALFSRSETGLLTGESGPTMPGVGMSEIINLKK